MEIFHQLLTVSFFKRRFFSLLLFIFISISPSLICMLCLSNETIHTSGTEINVYVHQKPSYHRRSLAFLKYHHLLTPGWECIPTFFRRSSTFPAIYMSVYVTRETSSRIDVTQRKIASSSPSWESRTKHDLITTVSYSRPVLSSIISPLCYFSRRSRMPCSSFQNDKGLSSECFKYTLRQWKSAVGKYNVILVHNGLSGSLFSALLYSLCWSRTTA